MIQTQIRAWSEEKLEKCRNAASLAMGHIGRNSLSVWLHTWFSEAWLAKLTRSMDWDSKSKGLFDIWRGLNFKWKRAIVFYSKTYGYTVIAGKIIRFISGPVPLQLS